MRRRVLSQEVRVRLDRRTYLALCERAKLSNATLSTVLRRALSQSLAEAGAGAAPGKIADLLKRTLGPDLTAIKRLAQLAALDAAEAKLLAREILFQSVPEGNEDWFQEQIRKAQAVAVQRVSAQYAPVELADPLTRKEVFS